jgi:hypothetical protein
MLNSISFLSVVGLVAVTVPGRASSMIRIFFQFAQLDVLPMDEIFEKTLTFDDVTDEAWNEYFDALGFSSLNLLRNLGSALVFLLLEFFLIILVGLAWILRKIFKK